MAPSFTNKQLVQVPSAAASRKAASSAQSVRSRGDRIECDCNRSGVKMSPWLNPQHCLSTRLIPWPRLQRHHRDHGHHAGDQMGGGMAREERRPGAWARPPTAFGVGGSSRRSSIAPERSSEASEPRRRRTQIRGRGPFNGHRGRLAVEPMTGSLTFAEYLQWPVCDGQRLE